MFGFNDVIYSRPDKPDNTKSSKLVASQHASELGKIGEKIKVGVYRLSSVTDVAGLPEPKKSDTEKSTKKKSTEKEK